MVTATITSKGQITIPKAIRDSLRLRTGDRVAFVLRGDAEAILKPVSKSVDDVYGKLYSPAQPPRSAEEMKNAVAERMRMRSRKP